ncbi:MAG: glucosamine-6-phosphate isomerase [Spirochaetales bacterium]|nr:glucosamine-6-phosphate isomerase [Spirochaetales bacterium]
MYTEKLCSGGPYPLPLHIVETDIDLYYHMALSMYLDIEKNNRENRETVFILPVGPVFQYRRFVFLLQQRPLRLAGVHWFFMDEYLDENRKLIDPKSPLSFRGFIASELSAAVPEGSGFDEAKVHFPDPDNPQDYDRMIQHLGGADTCFAGVGINGHIAFNEPPETPAEVETFRASPTRVIRLSRETRAINSNTALGGAYEKIPEYAVTVGFASVAGSKKVRVYMNRPWQKAVVRKLLFGPVTETFPASLLREHPDTEVIVTREVAELPGFGLR